jgi:hypothetical protein
MNKEKKMREGERDRKRRQSEYLQTKHKSGAPIAFLDILRDIGSDLNHLAGKVAPATTAVPVGFGVGNALPVGGVDADGSDLDQNAMSVRELREG